MATSIRSAIEQFQAKQERTYKNDAYRIESDSNSAIQIAGDHAGRCLLELIQNAEDADADTIEIRITNDALYFSDNGLGFKPEAIESIGHTYCSNKSKGMIGRKGVGFNAVYLITSMPKLLTRRDEGLEFNPKKARQWFLEKKLNCEKHLPFQRIPFFLSRSEYEKHDSTLSQLSSYSTIICLPFKSETVKASAINQLKEWDSTTLLAFRNIKTVIVEGPETSYLVEIARDDNECLLHDSRYDQDTKWKVMRESLIPPKKVRDCLDPTERERYTTVELLVAAPIDSDMRVMATEKTTRIHVYYPTQRLSPVRLFLHADFNVKTDRTDVLALDGDPLNDWIADQLASLIVEFVNRSYNSESPSSNIRLLVPINFGEERTLTKQLWDKIEIKASEELKLPDARGKRSLTIEKSRTMSDVCIKRTLARKILSMGPARDNLLHESFDSDEGACKALESLGCQSYDEEDIIRSIEEHAHANSSEKDLIWTSFCWLFHWYAEKKWDPDRTKRIGQLPLLPINGRLVPPEAIRDKIVTWREDEVEIAVPEWLPLAFVDDWFRDKILESDRANFHEKLGIKRPNSEMHVNALKKSVDAYWKGETSDPERFVKFILDRGLTSSSLESLANCPVPARVTGTEGTLWIRAKEAYFGREWGEVRVERLYANIKGIAFVSLDLSDHDREEQRALLESLGVTAYPKVRRDEVLSSNDMKRQREELRKRRLQVTTITTYAPALLLDRLSPDQLDMHQATDLIALIILHWDAYYRDKHEAYLDYFYYIEKLTKVTVRWWYQILNELKPFIEKNESSPYPLNKCWMPDDSTRKALGDLLPIINLTEFGEDEERVKEWLKRNVSELRTNSNEIKVAEWNDLLSNMIPRIVPLERAIIREQSNRIGTWYDACLSSLEKQITWDDTMYGALRNTLILCMKGDEVSYRNAAKEGPIYIADNDEYNSAFRDDIWLTDLISSHRRALAKKFFNLKMLSKEVRVEIRHGPEIEERSRELNDALKRIRPFVFAYRASKIPENRDKLSAKIRALEAHAVDGLHAILDLPGVKSKDVERQWSVQGDQLFIDVKHLSKGFETLLGGCIGVALDQKSEASLYEILLISKSEAEYMNRLSYHGMTEAEVNKLLFFYNDLDSSHVLPKTKNIESGTSTTDTQPNPSEQRVVPTSKQEGGGSSDLSMTHRPAPIKDDERRPVLLKDLNTSEIKLSSARREPRARERDSLDRDSGATSHTRIRVHHEDKMNIEDVGRKAVGKKLLELGYSNIEQEELLNPGFDIKATKNGIELHVEVKSHSGSIITQGISTRQVIQEPLECLKGNKCWQLWIVENLSRENPNPITITRYDEISDDALSSVTLRIDLSKCTPIQE